MEGTLLERLLAVHVAFLWQTVLVAASLFLVLRQVPLQRARLRYGIALGAFLVVLGLPLVGIGRALSFERVGGLGRPAAAPGTPVTAQPGRAVAAASGLPEVENGSAVVVGEVFGAESSASRFWISAWLAGVLFLSVRNLVAWRRVLQLRRLDAQPAPGPWQARLETLANRFRLRRRVRLFVSTRIDSPLTAGWWRPIVFVPAGVLTGLSPLELEALLLHELAHVRRWDYVVNLVQVAVETLFFYHPAVWWMSYALRVERENACDDMAVAACGDRVTYVSALASLEETRAPFSFAMQARGTDLLPRARRLLATDAHRGRHATRGKAPFGVGTMIAFPMSFVALTGLTVFALPSGASSTATLPPAFQESLRTPVEVRQGELQGLWLGEWKQDRFQIQMRRKGAFNEWNNSTSFERSELEGLTLGSDVSFYLKRDAGTITFTGDLQGTLEVGDGTGRFSFSPNAQYIEEMKELGYRGLKVKELFDLALFRISAQTVRELRDLGYRPSLKELITMGIHGVSPASIQSFRDVGYTDLSIRTLVSMHIHDVTPEFARQVRQIAPDEEVSAKTLIELQIHDVTVEFAREVGRLGYEDFRLKDLRNLRIHDITSDFIRSVEAELQESVPLKRLVELKIHDVTPTYMRDMRSRFQSVEAKDLVKMKIHDIRAVWIDEMRELGFTFDADDAVRMSIHNVTAEFVRKLRQDGAVVDTVDEAVRRRIHGGRAR